MRMFAMPSLKRVGQGKFVEAFASSALAWSPDGRALAAAGPLGVVAPQAVQTGEGLNSAVLSVTIVDVVVLRFIYLDLTVHLSVSRRTAPSFNVSLVFRLAGNYIC